jgi:hypothetical protein
MSNEPQKVTVLNRYDAEEKLSQDGKFFLVTDIAPLVAELNTAQYVLGVLLTSPLTAPIVRETLQKHLKRTIKVASMTGIDDGKN